MGGFGIPKGGYKIYNAEVMSSRKRVEWQCIIFGMERPKYEWAQIIGHVAPTYEYKSMGKNGRWELRRTKMPRRSNAESQETLAKY